MGMLDQEIIFSDGQAVTAVGDTPSTNVYDMAGGTTAALIPGGNGAGDVGLTGEMLWLQVVARTLPTSGGAATIQAVLQSSADNATWVDAGAGPVVPVANIPTAGYHLMRMQPPVLPAPGMSRYWRIVYRIATAVLTAGTFDAYVSNTLERNIQRASGFTI